MAKNRKTIVMVPADGHSGSVFGLMKPEQWQLGDGGFYNPTASNRVVYDQFKEVTHKIRAIRKKDKNIRLIVVSNGDAVDGNHHGTTQIVTPKVSEHEAMHTAVMDDGLKTMLYTPERGDLLYYIGGTPAHVGGAWQSEERIARDLSAVPYLKGTAAQEYKDGRSIWPYLKLDVNGVLFDISHQGEVGPGRRAWTTDNGLRSFLKSMYFTMIDRKQRIPRYWLRAHHHVFTASQPVGGRQGTIEGFILPALQTKTDYVYKIAASAMSTIGVWWCEVEPDGQSQWHCDFVEYEQDEIITV